MRADIFVHPDFLNRVRNREIDESINPIYLDYLRKIKEKMLVAEFGVLAYQPTHGDTGDPDTNPEYTDLFSKGGRIAIPTKDGDGEPFDQPSYDLLNAHLEKLCPELIVIHGSYASLCVKRMANTVRSINDQRVVIGTVLSRYFGDIYPVPHEWFSEMHPDMADMIDPQETDIHGIRYL